LAQHACWRGQSAYYQRVPRLGEELRIRHANGTFTRWLETLKNTDVLLLDDWGMTAMDGPTRADLLEIIDDRASARATIITSQLPIEHWHDWIGDANPSLSTFSPFLARTARQPAWMLGSSPKVICSAILFSL
jgi:DNA replication protein DnaC